jgi:hypothetical protein
MESMRCCELVRGTVRSERGRKRYEIVELMRGIAACEWDSSQVFYYLADPVVSSKYSKRRLDNCDTCLCGGLSKNRRFKRLSFAKMSWAQRLFRDQVKR